MASPIKIPPSIANASREELEKLFVATLQKLKARDRKIEELAKASEQSVQSTPQPDNEANNKIKEDTIAALQAKLLSKEEAFNERLSAETELLAGQIADLRKDLERERENSSELQKQLAERASFIARLENDIEKQTAEIDHITQNAKKETDAAYQQMQEEKDRLLKDIQVAKETASKNQEEYSLQIDMLTQQLDASKNQLEALHAQHEEHQKHTPSNDDTTDVSARITALQEDLASAQKQAQHAEEQYAITKKALEDVQSESSARISSLEGRITDLQSSRDNAAAGGDTNEQAVPASPPVQNSTAIPLIATGEEFDSASSTLSLVDVSSIVTPGPPPRDANESILRIEFEKLAKELSDTKRKFVVATKKRQQESANKIAELERQLADALKIGGGGEETATATRGNTSSTHPSENTAANDDGHGSISIDGLRQAADAARAEVIQIRKEVEIERNRFKKAIAESKRRNDGLHNEKTKAEAALKDLEATTTLQLQSLQSKLIAIEEEKRIAESSVATALHELAEYKTRAHALLKSKETQLRDAKDVALEHHAAALESAEAAAHAAEAAAKRAQQELDAVKRVTAEERQSMQQEHAASIARLQKEISTSNDAATAATRQYEQLKLRYESLDLRLKEIREQHAISLKRAVDAEESLASSLASVRAEHEALAKSSEAALRGKDEEIAAAKNATAVLKREMASLRATVDAGGNNNNNTSNSNNNYYSTGNRKSGSGELRSITASIAVGGGGNTVLDGGANDNDNIDNIDNVDDNDMLERFSSDISFGFPHQQATTSNSMPGHNKTASFSFDTENTIKKKKQKKQNQRQQQSSDDSDVGGVFAELSQRERELAAAERTIQELEREIRELEGDVELHTAQEKVLKDAVRDLERELQRVRISGQQVDMEYFKNVMLKLFETGQEESLLPVVATVMQFSPAELERCRVALEGRKARYAAQTAKDSAANVTSYFSSWLGSSDGP